MDPRTNLQAFRERGGPSDLPLGEPSAFAGKQVPGPTPEARPRLPRHIIRRDRDRARILSRRGELRRGGGIEREDHATLVDALDLGRVDELVAAGAVLRDVEDDAVEEVGLGGVEHLDDRADLHLVGGVDGDAFFGGEVRDLVAQIVHRERTLNEEGRRHLNSGWEQSESGGTRMGTNLASIVTDSAARDAGAAAIRLGERTLTYGELDDRAARLATLLRERGLEPGDRVGVMLPNVPYFPIAYYGVLRAGGVVVPLNPLLKEREVAYHLGDSGARVLLAWHESADAAHAGAEQAGADCVLVEPGSLEALAAR